MLVLTRKNNEEILLDSNIRIRVLSVRGNSVRIGIEAPNSVSIKRAELVQKQELPDCTAAQIVALRHLEQAG